MAKEDRWRARVWLRQVLRRHSKPTSHNGDTALDNLVTFLRRLDEAGIHYSLGSFRDSVNVLVTTPTNERGEVEFFADGGVEVERFC